MNKFCNVAKVFCHCFI